MKEKIKEINLTNVEYIKHLENAIKDLNKYNDNLQQQNEDLKLQLRGTTHCFDEHEHDELKNQIKELQYKYNLALNDLVVVDKRISNAIEYINGNKDKLCRLDKAKGKTGTYISCDEELLDILKGDEK